MTPDEKPRFLAALSVLGDVFRCDLTAPAIEGYWRALVAFPLDEVEEATQRALETCRHMPRPAELRALIEGDPADRAVLAWGGVLRAIRRIGAYDSVRLDDPAATEAIKTLGGWPAVCQGSCTWTRKDFLAAYEAVVRSQVRLDHATLPGLLEAGGGQYTTHQARLGAGPVPERLRLGEGQRLLGGGS